MALGQLSASVGSRAPERPGSPRMTQYWNRVSWLIIGLLVAAIVIAGLSWEMRMVRRPQGNNWLSIMFDAPDGNESLRMTNF